MGREVAFSSVKQTAQTYGIPVWQPGSFKKQENRQALAAYKADLYIVAAFGQILPQEVLDQPRYGTLNIHASLLPKYRGPDPIAEAILQGDEETGVSIMLLDAGVDTGPVLMGHRIAISNDETLGSLTIKLAELGAQTLREALPLWIGGKLQPEQQDEAACDPHTHVAKRGWQDFLGKARRRPSTPGTRPYALAGIVYILAWENAQNYHRPSL